MPRHAELKVNGGLNQVSLMPVLSGEFKPRQTWNLFVFTSPQLAGTAVLAIGLWLRFDPQTAEIFKSDQDNTAFSTGKSLRASSGLDREAAAS